MDTRSGPAVVELEAVCVRYGDVEALHDVTLRIPAATTVAVIGPNGSGKSTLLGVISGLVTPDSGHARVLGRDPARQRGRVAHVLQSTSLRPEVPMTVAEAVRLGTYAELGLLGRPGRAVRERFDDAVARLGLTDLVDRQLPELSGGQRQRVLLAQGLVQGAELLLLDEPASGLDLPSQEVIARTVRDERARGRTVISTTHDIGVAAANDLVVLIATGVVAFGTPSEVLTPENLSRAFGGHLHVLPNGTLVLDDPVHHSAPGGTPVADLDHAHDHGGTAGPATATTPG